MDIYTIEEIVLLRKVGKMSVEEFWSFLDLTKQTGYNLEKGKTAVSKAILIAATTVINYLYSKDGVDPHEVLNEYKKIESNYVVKNLMGLIK